ncbi:BgTH12-03498 [Blumeria graminis f. sp. triticale]|uniref:Bgt-50479 n=2 Tax=Blumeria graminis TaxID=34373 RepID=A0A9X9L877_BLUGR|nr:BgTH12-03498 [Blumeria graminis f. sp. triticale]VCU39531.1 Bgt-50479 [Blumeria graminis f. sp. tritici]
MIACSVAPALLQPVPRLITPLMYYSHARDATNDPFRNTAPSIHNARLKVEAEFKTY